MTKKQKNNNEDWGLFAAGIKFACESIKTKFFPNDDDFIDQCRFVKTLPDGKKMRVWRSQKTKEFRYSVQDK